MSKGQPLPYPLDACAGCLDLTAKLAQLATVTNERNAAQKEIIEVLRICTDGFGRPDGPSIPDRKRVYHLLAQMEAQP